MALAALADVLAPMQSRVYLHLVQDINRLGAQYNCGMSEGVTILVRTKIAVNFSIVKNQSHR